MAYRQLDRGHIKGFGGDQAIHYYRTVEDFFRTGINASLQLLGQPERLLK